MCGFLFVRGWVAKAGIFSSACLTSVKVSRGSPLSILAQRPHKEVCLRKPAEPEERTKDVGELIVRPRRRESDIRSSERGPGKLTLKRGAGESRLG